MSDDGARAPEVVWSPGPEVIARSRLRRLYAAHGYPDYDAWYAHSVADPAAYWGEVVADLGLTWRVPYERVLDLSQGAPWAEWFTGGHFNYVENALDRHVAAGAGDRTAIIWEGDDGAVVTLTYAELLAATNRLAHALRQLGVGKGDRVGIFLPMLPETAIATLACGKLGAIYLPMFSGFGPEAIASRLRDGADEGGRRRGPDGGANRDAVPGAAPYRPGCPLAGGTRHLVARRHRERAGCVRDRRYRRQRSLHDHLHLRHHRPAEGRGPCSCRLPDQGGP